MTVNGTSFFRPYFELIVASAAVPLLPERYLSAPGVHVFITDQSPVSGFVWLSFHMGSAADSHQCFFHGF